MNINRRFFPEVTLDNDEVFLGNLTGIIEAVDELASLEITKAPNFYHFRIAPSLPKYSEMLLQEIFKFHTLFHIRIDASKSIKASGTINFSIEMNIN
jgi:hypothetical protein